MLQRLQPTVQICSKVKVAKSFKSRLVGLIGTQNMNDYALYIPECNWIHTFFMSCAIDVVYIDKKMQIKKIDHELKPWRLARPVLSAQNVIELEAGTARKFELKIGEVLHVGH